MVDKTSFKFVKLISNNLYPIGIETSLEMLLLFCIVMIKS